MYLVPEQSPSVLESPCLAVSPPPSTRFISHTASAHSLRPPPPLPYVRTSLPVNSIEDTHKEQLVAIGKNGGLRVSFTGGSSFDWGSVYAVKQKGFVGAPESPVAGIRARGVSCVRDDAGEKNDKSTALCTGSNMTIAETGMTGSFVTYFSDAMASIGINKFEVS